MNSVCPKCEQSVNMKNGDGLADAVSAVCVVAGPEEQEQAKRSGSGSCSLLFVCCSVWHVLFFSLYVSRECPYHRAHAHAHDPPATKDTDAPPRHIYSSRTQDFGTKRELEQKRIPRCIGRYDTRGYCGERAGKRGQFQYSSKSDRVQEVDRVWVCVGMG